MGTTVVAEEGDRSVRQGPEKKNEQRVRYFSLKHLEMSNQDQPKENESMIINRNWKFEENEKILSLKDILKI